MRRSRLVLHAARLIAPALVFGTTTARASVPDDTVRTRVIRSAETRDRGVVGAVIPGFLSSRGLPPIEGALVVSDTGLVFRTADGASLETFPMVGPVRRHATQSHRATAVALAYVVEGASRPAYLFRLDGAVFETAVPSVLLELAQHPPWLDTMGSREWTVDRPLIDGADTEAALQVVGGIASSPYADSLYALFGRPVRRSGLIAGGGRRRGRLGEYIASRDSLALDPGRIANESQLRHAFTHELAHRWQSRARHELRSLWTDVATVRDPRRYGYASATEQQAEAIAFAIHFLQSTAGGRAPVANQLRLLDHYEFLVPGTRVLARYFALQPVYGAHPLHAALTLGATSPT